MGLALQLDPEDLSLVCGDEGMGVGGSSELKQWVPPGGSRHLATSSGDGICCHFCKHWGEEEV